MNNDRQHAPSFPRADIQTLLCQWDQIPHQVLQYHECPSILSYFNSIVLVLLLNSTTCVRIVNKKLKLQNKTGSNIRRGTFCLFCMNLHIYSIAKIDIIKVIKVETFLPVTSLLLGLLQYKIQNINIRVDRSEENFPKSILTMVFGCQNASGWAFIKGKNFEKLS